MDGRMQFHAKLSKNGGDHVLMQAGFLIVTAGLVFVPSALAENDPELKAEASCFSELAQYQKSVESTACAVGANSPVAVLALRYAKRGVYLFDQKTGQARFYELKKAPSVALDKEHAGSYYELKNPVGGGGLSVFYSDREKVIPPKYAVSQAEIEKALAMDFPVSRAEVDEFISRKRIPKSQITQEVKGRIVNYLKEAKRTAKLTERDPQANDRTKLGDREFVACDSNGVLSQAMDLKSTPLDGEVSSDTAAKDALRAALVGRLSNASVDQAIVRSAKQSKVDAIAVLRKALKVCDSARDAEVRGALRRLQESLSQISPVIQDGSSSGGVSAAAPAE